MGDFIREYLGTIIQLAVTAWMAAIARNFQITLAVYGTRLETHREGMRWCNRMWRSEPTDPKAVDLLNEMRDWIMVNEVYLSPAFVDAFMDIHVWKLMQVTSQVPPGDPTVKENFRKATAAQRVLRTELLKFRKRPFLEALKDRFAAIRSRKRR
jgi:hypothetical protein